MDIPTSKVSLREEYKRHDFKKLISIFKTLPPGKIDKLQGEVRGTILATPNKLGDVISWLSTHSIYPGNWQGKGFIADQQGQSKTSGKGYNRFKFFGKEIRAMRFVTRQDNSVVDNKPVMLMDYKPAGNFLGWLKSLDEIRQIDENNYLLCGHWYWPLLGRSQLFFYHIYGPVNEYKDPL